MNIEILLKLNLFRKRHNEISLSSKVSTLFSSKMLIIVQHFYSSYFPFQIYSLFSANLYIITLKQDIYFILFKYKNCLKQPSLLGLEKISMRFPTSWQFNIVSDVYLKAHDVNLFSSVHDTQAYYVYWKLKQMLWNMYINSNIVKFSQS